MRRFSPDDRIAVKPGMSGLWQVTPRKDSFQERLELDKRYFESRSFGQDVRILFQTSGVVLNVLGR